MSHGTPDPFENTWTCALCLRNGEKLTRHHLIPKLRWKKLKKPAERAQAKEQILWICRTCHNLVHAVFTKRELEKEFNTPEKLRAHPEIDRFISWIRERNISGHVPVRKPNEVRERRRGRREGPSSTRR